MRCRASPPLSARFRPSRSNDERMLINEKKVFDGDTQTLNNTSASKYLISSKPLCCCCRTLCLDGWILDFTHLHTCMYLLSARRLPVLAKEGKWSVGDLSTISYHIFGRAPTHLDPCTHARVCVLTGSLSNTLMEGEGERAPFVGKRIRRN